RNAVYRHGRSLPYGQGTTFWALGEIVRAEAGILHSDRGASIAAKLRRTVGASVPDARDADWISGQLRPLVGLDLRQSIGADRQAEAFAAWRLFLESL